MPPDSTRTIRAVVDLSYRLVSNPGIAGLSSSRVGVPASGPSRLAGFEDARSALQWQYLRRACCGFPVERSMSLVFKPKP